MSSPVGESGFRDPRVAEMVESLVLHDSERHALAPYTLEELKDFSRENYAKIIPSKVRSIVVGKAIADYIKNVVLAEPEEDKLEFVDGRVATLVKSFTLKIQKEFATLNLEEIFLFDEDHLKEILGSDIQAKTLRKRIGKLLDFESESKSTGPAARPARPARPAASASAASAAPTGPARTRARRARRAQPAPTGPEGQPAGPTGPKGPTGPTGPKGPKGPKGPTAQPAPTGPEGQTAQPAGPKGPKGPKGPTAQPAPTGPKGPKGPGRTRARPVGPTANPEPRDTVSEEVLLRSRTYDILKTRQNFLRDVEKSGAKCQFGKSNTITITGKQPAVSRALGLLTKLEFFKESVAVPDSINIISGARTSHAQPAAESKYETNLKLQDLQNECSRFGVFLSYERPRLELLGCDAAKMQIAKKIIGSKLVISKVIEADPLSMFFLTRVRRDLLEKLQKNHKVQVTVESFKITDIKPSFVPAAAQLVGSESAVKRVAEELMTFLNDSIKKQKVKFDLNDLTRNQVVRSLSEANKLKICVRVFSRKDLNTVTCHTRFTDDQEFEEWLSRAQDLTKEPTKFTTSHDQMSLFDTQAKREDIMKSYGLVLLEHNLIKNELLILGKTQANTDAFLQDLQARQHGNQIGTREIRIDNRAVYLGLKGPFRKQIFAFARETCAIDVDDVDQIVRVTASGRKLDEICNSFQRLLRRFEDDLITVRHEVDAEACAIVSNNEDRIETKHQVLIETEDDEDSEDKGAVVLENGTRLLLKQKSIVDVRADAIVNAANSNLTHTGGVAQTIANAAGQKLIDECKSIIKSRTEVTPGSAVVTTAGNIANTKYVVHAVAPLWRDGQYSEPETLHNAIRSAFEKVEGMRGVSSIALPVVGSGKFGYPLQMCCATILNSIRYYFSTCKDSALKEVVVCDVDKSKCNAFQLAIERAIAETDTDQSEEKVADESEEKDTEITIDYQWYWQDDDSSWVPYGYDQNVQIEREKREGKPQTSTLCGDLGKERNGRFYRVNFETMLQKNVNTLGVRAVKRQEIPPQVRTKAHIYRPPEHERTSPAKLFPFEKPNTFIKITGESSHVRKAIADIEQLLNDSKTSIEITPRLEITDQAKAQLLVKAKFHRVKLEILKNGAISISGYRSQVENAKEDIYQFALDSKQEKFPEHWNPDQLQNCELFELDLHSAEAKNVARLFKETMPQKTIRKIERVQNKLMWRSYQHEVEKLLKKHGRTFPGLELQLFHGTRNTAPELIYKSEKGFDMRFSNWGMWGQACYFAVDASYSHSYRFSTPDGSAQMFLVRVLVGDSIELARPDDKLKMPPPNPRPVQNPQEIHPFLYDSVNGLTKNCRVYMVYEKDRGYPEYLITYAP